MPLFIILQDAASEVTVEFPLDAGYRLLTPRKSPHQFPGGGFAIPCDHRSNGWPQGQPDKPADFHNLHLDRCRLFHELRNLVVAQSEMSVLRY